MEHGMFDFFHPPLWNVTDLVNCNHLFGIFPAGLCSLVKVTKNIQISQCFVSFTNQKWLCKGTIVCSRTIWCCFGTALLDRGPPVCLFCFSWDPCRECDCYLVLKTKVKGRVLACWSRGSLTPLMSHTWWKTRRKRSVVKPVKPRLPKQNLPSITFSVAGIQINKNDGIHYWESFRKGFCAFQVRFQGWSSRVGSL